jgi:hypothetical protein
VASALASSTPLIPPADAPEVMSTVAHASASRTSWLYAFFSIPRLARTSRQTSNTTP